MTETSSRTYTVEDYRELFGNFLWDTGYRRTIIDLADTCKGSEAGLEIDFKDIEKYSEKRDQYNILDAIINTPGIVLKGMKKAIEDQLHPDQKGKVIINPRLVNLPSNNEVRVSEIRAPHIGKLIRSTGRIKKIRAVSPKIVTGAFKCLRCEAVIRQEQPNDTFLRREPLECYKNQGGCKRDDTSWEFLPAHSIYRNLQIVWLEETFDSIKPHQPESKRVFLWDDIAGIYPTNDVVISSVVKGLPFKKSSIPEIYLDAIGVKFPEDYYRNVTLTEKDKREIEKQFYREDNYKELVASIAPTVRGHEDIKEGILLVIFGGVDKIMRDGTRRRGKSHILIIGDPSTAKTLILQYVQKLAPRSIYGSGEGSTGVGLTYAVTKDEIDKRWCVELGILPMANGGIAIVDEIDKMSKEDRERLHTALESGILPIAKAGIVNTLNADCTLIAGGNPKLGRFSSDIPLAGQIDLSPPLLSRFDLIFGIQDISTDYDRELTNHILETHKRYNDEYYLVTEPPIEPEFFKKMVKYAWLYLRPELTDEAVDVLRNYYLKLRKDNDDENKVPMTWRQLEGLIRLSEAKAKTRGSQTVDKEDAKRVVSLFEKSLYASCFNDFDFLTTGYKQGQRERIQLYVDFLRAKGSAIEMEITEFAQENGIDEDICKGDIKKLEEEGRIYKIKGAYRL